MEKLFKLSDKVRDFAKFYKGDLIEALQAAGYKGSEQYLRQLGNDLLRQPDVIKIIQENAKYLKSKALLIADKEEIQVFLSNTMRNEDPEFKRVVGSDGAIKELDNITMPNRLKAAELLGKSQGMYVDRLDVSGKLTLTDIVRKAYTVDDSDIEDIEAEYIRVKEEKKLRLESPGEVNPFSEPEYETEVSAGSLI